jgi:hypothetical protein
VSSTQCIATVGSRTLTITVDKPARQRWNAPNHYTYGGVEMHGTLEQYYFALANGVDPCLFGADSYEKPSLEVIPPPGRSAAAPSSSSSSSSGGITAPAAPAEPLSTPLEKHLSPMVSLTPSSDYRGEAIHGTREQYDFALANFLDPRFFGTRHAALAPPDIEEETFEDKVQEAAVQKEAVQEEAVQEQQFKRKQFKRQQFKRQQFKRQLFKAFR